MVFDSHSNIAINLCHEGPIPLGFLFLSHLVGHYQQDLIKLSEIELKVLDEKPRKCIT